MARLFARSRLTVALSAWLHTSRAFPSVLAGAPAQLGLPNLRGHVRPLASLCVFRVDPFDRLGRHVGEELPPGKGIFGAAPIDAGFNAQGSRRRRGARGQSTDSATAARRLRDAKRRWDRKRGTERELEARRMEALDAGGANAVTPAETHASDELMATAVGHPALIITRPIEWGTVLFGYEQANKYTVLDQSGAPVALIAEDVGLGNIVGRQLLRTRRSFTATVFTADGTQVLFRIRRPMYLISSTMHIEDGEGNSMGEIRQRWHLWQRNYDLYMDKQQFAKIEGNFLAWEFQLKDADGGSLALIDRNFQGFGKELFTDAGKYVIHFGQPPEEAAREVTATLRSRTNNPNLPPVTPLAKMRTDVEVIPSQTGSQLVVARKLNLDERMVTLACAMTIDYDYFSQHSHTSGWAPVPMFMPVPMGGGAQAGEAAGAEAAGEAASGGVPGATPPGSETAGQSAGQEAVLEGDEFQPTPESGETLDEGDDVGDGWFGGGDDDGDSGGGWFGGGGSDGGGGWFGGGFDIGD